MADGVALWADWRMWARSCKQVRMMLAMASTEARQPNKMVNISSVMASFFWSAAVGCQSSTEVLSHLMATGFPA